MKRGRGGLVHISDCKRAFFEKHLLEPEGYALRIFFSEFVGPKIAKYASLVKVDQSTIVIAVKSSVVKNEIMLSRKKLLKVMNDFLVKNRNNNKTSSGLKKIVFIND
ncbi:MAG: hypothetical protein BWY26_01058 [Elusimicrobia bacterium ADurb.Bin231]|nr:MAG: hypothetical protein BWY26_01058 [Elusimicrobia bacterium ADurb.Bin231]